MSAVGGLETGPYCPSCGAQMVAEVHRRSGSTACLPGRFGERRFVEDREQEVLEAAIAMVRAWRLLPEPLAELPRIFVGVLDRADALLDAYDPGSRSPWSS